MIDDVRRAARERRAQTRARARRRARDGRRARRRRRRRHDGDRPPHSHRRSARDDRDEDSDRCDPPCAVQRVFARAVFMRRSDSRASGIPIACAHSPGKRRASQPMSVSPAVRVVSGIVGSRMTRESSSINRARSVSSPTRCPPGDIPVSDDEECTGFSAPVEFDGRATRRTPVLSRISVSVGAGVPGGGSKGDRGTAAGLARASKDTSPNPPRCARETKGVRWH